MSWGPWVSSFLGFCVALALFFWINGARSQCDARYRQLQGVRWVSFGDRIAAVRRGGIPVAATWLGEILASDAIRTPTNDPSLRGLRRVFWVRFWFGLAVMVACSTVLLEAFPPS